MRGRNSGGESRYIGYEIDKDRRNKSEVIKSIGIAKKNFAKVKKVFKNMEMVFRI